MNKDEHRARAERIERSLSKLPVSDHEAVIDACVLASGQWVNFGLHSLKVTPDDEDFIHVQKLDVRQQLSLKETLGAEVMRILEVIDGYRPFFVRGDDPGGDLAAQRALELLSIVRNKILDSVDNK